MTELEKLRKGYAVDGMHPELYAINLKAHNLSIEYSGLMEDDPRRQEILDQLLGSHGNVFMRGPIYFNFGVNTHLGDNFFANNDFHVSDDAEVRIGDNVMCGPHVSIITATHPYMPEERRGMTDSQGNTFRPLLGNPITIGNDVFIGGGAMILGGVTIGDGSVIGAGSVVTKDIPAGVIAAGNPCKVIRKITQADSIRHKIL